MTGIQVGKTIQKEPPKQALAEVEDIGSIIRGERMTKGMTLEDVHEKLKIRPEIIDAIENNDLESVGRPQYLTGYLRSYARLLGMDPEFVLSAYAEKCGLPRQVSKSKSNIGAKPSFDITKKRKRGYGHSLSDIGRATSLVLSLVIGFALIGGVVYVGARFLSGFQTLDIVPTQSRPTALTENQMPVADEEQIGVPENVATMDYDELYQRQALQTPVVTPRAGRIADVDINTVGAFAEGGEPMPTTTIVASATSPITGESTSTPNGPVVTVGPTIPQIELLPYGEAWVRLTNEDGEVILEKLLAPGETVEVPVDGYIPVLRRAGNAGELYVRVNGKVFGPIGKDGASVVNNIPLTPDAVATSYEEVDVDLLQKFQEKEESYLAKNEG